MTRQVWRRPGVWAATIALIGVTAGGVAQAAGPYAYLFGVNEYGAHACTTQTRTASTTLAPYIEVEVTSYSPSSNPGLFFYGSYTNCQPYSGASDAYIQKPGGGYYAIYTNDHPGNLLKLTGETGPYETGTLTKGYWKT